MSFLISGYTLHYKLRWYQGNVISKGFPNFYRMNKEESLKKLRSLLPALARKYPIEKMGIFGSVARGEQRPDSDLDIIALFNGPIG